MRGHVTREGLRPAGHTDGTHGTISTIGGNHQADNLQDHQGTISTIGNQLANIPMGQLAR